MDLIRQIRRVFNCTTGISVIFLFSCLLSVGYAAQTAQPYTETGIVAFFSGAMSKKVSEIYNRIPGSLVKFLDQKKVLKKFTFQDDLTNVDIRLGNEKSKSLDLFQRELRNSLRKRFLHEKITEIQAEDFAKDIKEQYEKQMKGWAKKGEMLTNIITFNKTYEAKFGEHWTRVDAYVYLFLSQKLENNWISENNYKISYELSIDIKGASLDSKKAATFTQLVTESNVEDTVKIIRAKAPIAWDDEF